MVEQTKLISLSRRWQITVAVTLLSAVIAFASCFRLEVLIEDFFLVHLTKPVSAPDNIVLVAVDEDTLAKMPYRSPVDRSFLARIVKQIDQARPRAIGIDLLIDQPSEAAKDAALLNALRQAKSPIIMGFATASDGLTEKQIAFQAQALKGLQKGLVTLTRDDFDGTVRQIYPGRVVKGNWLDGFSTALAKQSGIKQPYPAGRINFYHGLEGQLLSFTTYPAHAVKLLPPVWFKNKIVLIGSTLPTTDRHPTPFVTSHGAKQGTAYGMAIHAHILAQLIRGDRLTGPDRWTSVAIVIALAAFAGFIVFTRLAPLVSVSIVGVVLLLYLACAYQFFAVWQIQLPIATPVVAAVISSIILALVQWYRDRAQRLFIEKAFSQYVSPAVVRRIAEHKHSLLLGGETRMVTYVFTDLQGFTSLSETMPPAQIASLLNNYLDEVCQLFAQADATIDKIVGDAVIGFFGAPEQQDDQAERAVKLALAVDKFSQKYSQAQSQKGVAFGRTRIGVHKGKAIIGNFGGSRFFDYTGIGDTVNTAARMEAANRQLGTHICVSEAVARDCPNQAFRPIGNIVLKGKRVPIPCFEALHPDAASPQMITRYQAAFELINQLDGTAPSAFAQLAQDFPGDPLIKLHARRLQNGAKDATITLTEK